MRYVPTKFSKTKKTDEDTDWWQDGVPIRRARPLAELEPTDN